MTVAFYTKNGQLQEENEKNQSKFAIIKYKSCKFCGGSWYKHADCPANQCNCMGYFAKVCLSKIKKILMTLATVCRDKEKYLYISALKNPISNEKVNVILLIYGI